MNEEKRAQIARDAEIARQWDEEERKRAMDEAKTTKKIDWNDPSVIRYHSLKMKPKTIAQARRNMIKYLKNQGNFKISQFKGIGGVRGLYGGGEEGEAGVMGGIWGVCGRGGWDVGGRRSRGWLMRKSLGVGTGGFNKAVLTRLERAKATDNTMIKSTRKRQKIEEDSEKEELKEFLDIIPREEVPIEVESISTKFPIVDWKSYVYLIETFMYYQVFRGDGSSKNYKIFTEMLRDFDRHDVEELYRLVKERYRASSPEGYDLMLWGDLHTMFEPNEDDELWKNQHQYNLLSWIFV
ncbi:hypothetical protein Tco_0645588 [Tanacetum coccineum]